VLQLSPFGAVRVSVLALVAALAALLLAVSGALLPARPASAATTASSVRISFVGAGIWGGSLRSTYALTTKPVPAQFYASKSWSGSNASVTAIVERRVSGGAWKATGQRVSTTSATFRVSFPAYSSSASAGNPTVEYRLRVRTGGVVRAGDVSDAITVHYRNPARFTGFVKTLYRAVHPYCPSALPRVVRLSGDAAGDFTTGQFALRIDTSIRSYVAVDQRAVAIHECGHYLQWRNYGASSAGWSRMKADAKAIFGTNSSEPVEHMADCIARAANPGGYLGYGGTCTATQLAASKRMLAGHRAR
jgi:hypothetical protein